MYEHFVSVLPRISPHWVSMHAKHNVVEEFDSFHSDSSTKQSSINTNASPTLKFVENVFAIPSVKPFPTEIYQSWGIIRASFTSKPAAEASQLWFSHICQTNHKTIS